MLKIAHGATPGSLSRSLAEGKWALARASRYFYDNPYLHGPIQGQIQDCEKKWLGVGWGGDPHEC